MIVTSANKDSSVSQREIKRKDPILPSMREEIEYNIRQLCRSLIDKECCDKCEQRFVCYTEKEFNGNYYSA